MKLTKRTSIILFIVLLLVATAGLAAAMIIPSADELLTGSIETLENVTDGHAIISATVEFSGESHGGRFEAWGKLDAGPNGEPAYRVQVLEAEKDELLGVIVVSDGAQFWLYNPSRNTVIVGQAEEIAPLLAEKMAEYEGQWDYEGQVDPEGMSHPETPAEAVAKFLEYFTAERDGQEAVGENEAYRIRLVPIVEQMPEEFRAAGGFVNLWVRTTDQLPLAAEYAESSLGYARFEALVAEINIGLSGNDEIFSFDIPAGTEVIQAVDLLAEWEASAVPLDFEAYSPTYLPEGITAAEPEQIAGTIVQRFNWPDDRSFVLAQGAASGDGLPVERPPEATTAEMVTVRGFEATLYTNDEGTRSLLFWYEDDRSVLVGGDITPEQATAVAESLQ